MTAEDRNPAVNATSGAPFPEFLVSSVLPLMSHYSAGSKAPEDDNQLASVIERHLQTRSDQPGITPVLRETCLQPSTPWAAPARRNAAPAPRPGSLVRLLAGAGHT